MNGRMLEMPRNSVSPVFVALSETDMLDLLRAAIRRVSGSDKAGAIDMDVSSPQLSKWLNGVEPCRLGQLSRSAAIQREFAYLLAERCGHDVRRVSDNERRRRRIVEIHAELVELVREEASA